MDQTKRPRAEAWFRYADDLGIGPYYLDRAAQAPPDFSGAPSSGSGRVVASGEISTPAPISSPAVAAAAVPKRAPDPAPPVIQRAAGVSLFESADRIEGDTLERIR